MIVKVLHILHNGEHDTDSIQLETGVGLTAFGLFFMLMGVMMLFDGGLMAIGNVSE